MDRLRRYMAEAHGDVNTLLEGLFRHAPFGLAVLDLEMRYLTVNEALAQMNGIAREDHLGKTIAEIVPSLYPEAAAAFQRVIQGEEFVSFELSGATAKEPGVERHWRESWFPIRVDAEIVAVAVTVEEITEARRAGQQLHDLQEAQRRKVEELQAVMDAAPAAIWIGLDRECRQMIGNPESYRLVEMPGGANPSASIPDSALQRGFREFHHGAPVPASALPMQVAARTGQEVRNVQLTLVFDDGHAKHIYGSAVPLRDEQHAVRGAVGAFVDITERVEAEQALKLADQRKNEFIATLAHELRNPLAPIRNAASLLRKSDDAGLRSIAVEMIERQMVHLGHLLDDLLDVARVSSGKLTLKRKVMDFRESIQEAVDAVRPALDERGHHLDFRSGAVPLLVDADPVRLTQVVVNLLTNAVKYTPNGGHIELHVNAEGQWAVVRVRDNGIGIDPADLPRLFAIFTQLHPFHAHRDSGLGLGLALVRAIVELHGGTVQAASGGTGQGAEFTVRLPLLPREVGTQHPG